MRHAALPIALSAVLLFGAASLAGQSAPATDWKVHLDAPQRAASGQAVQAGEFRYTAMPPGWHVTTTDQGVTLVSPDRTLQGRWEIEVQLYLFPGPSDAPFGIVLDGADPALPPGAQLQFLIRADGAAAMRMLAGPVDSLVQPWTRDTALVLDKAADKVNVLRVSHDDAVLAFTVNGRELFAISAPGEGHRVAPGLRVGPGLNMHISRFDLITPLAPPRRRAN